MQNKSIKTILFLTFIPLVLSVLLFTSFISGKGFVGAVGEDNPIKVSLVTVNDTVPDDYQPGKDDASLILPNEKTEQIIWDGTTENIPFVLVDNTYSELSGSYTINNATSVTYKGATYTSTNGTFTIDGEKYYYNTSTNKILKKEGKHEAISISLGSTSEKYQTIETTIKLNGVEIVKNNPVSLGSQFQLFSQIIHGLTNSFIEGSQSEFGSSGTYFLTKENGTDSALERVEGLYEITINYRHNSGFPQTSNFAFYLITTNSYANEEESVKFSNTQKLVSTSLQDTYSIEHYFNQTNFNTTQKDGTSTFNQDTKSPLAYPTLNYNPEKYNVSYKRTLYSYVEQGEFSIELIESSGNMIAKFVERVYKTTNGQRELVSENSKLISRTTNELDGEYRIIAPNKISYEGNDVTSENGIFTINNTKYYFNELENKIKVFNEYAPFSATWVFEKLGDYEFYKYCTIRNKDNQFITATNITLSNANLLKTEALYINGFQATYTTKNGTSPFLKNETYKSDFTYLNDSVINSAGSVLIKKPTPAQISIDANKISINNTSVLEFDESILPSTNQPNVKLQYNAKLSSITGSNWYIYINKKNEVSVQNFTYGTTFYDAGTYFVYLSFKNNAVKTATVHTQQFIAFKISNTSPDVFVQTTLHENSTSLVNSLSGEVLPDENSKTLSSDSFTNQNVYLRWNKNGPFNAEITAEYILSDYNGNLLSSGSLSGLVCTNNGGLLYANDDATLFKENGTYTIKIYFTNSNSFITKSFTIDKNEITGIKALKVNPNTKQLANKDSLGDNILSDLSNFNLVLGLNPNQAEGFVWTWNEKQSGATITARYYYSVISYQEADYNTKSLQNSFGEEWILANGKFGLLSTAKDYAYTKVTEQNFKTIKFSSPQIFTTSRLGILVLEDEAGNTATFTSILDKISPEYIQQEEGSGENATSTMISKTTKLTWGSHKSLLVEQSEESENVSQLIEQAISSSSWKLENKTFKIDSKITSAIQTYFKKDSTNTIYYCQEIRNALLNLSGNTFTLYPTKTADGFKDTSVWVVINETNGEYITYLANSKDGTPLENIKLVVSSNNKMTARILTLSVFDKLDNQRNSTKQITLDHSQGSMFSHSKVVDNNGVTDTTEDPTKYSTANRKQLFEGNSTNRDFVTFSFLQQNNNFAVEKITLNFYALMPTTTKGSENYPYSNNPLTSVIFSKDESANDWNTITAENGTYYHSIALRKSATSQAGKYVITREYTQNFNQSTAGGDVNTLDYTFFVDRTGIISLSGSEYITGEDISLNFGLSEYKNYPEESQKIFKDFAKQTLTEREFLTSFRIDGIDVVGPSNTIVKSNILPVNTSLKLIDSIAYKYKYTEEIQDEETGKTTTEYKYNTENTNMRLMILIQQFNSSSNLVVQKLYSSAVNSNNKTELNKQNIFALSDLSSSTLKDIGTYRVIIVDTSNLTGELTGTWQDLKIWEYENFAPNYTIFSFQLSSVPPTTSAVTQNNERFTTLYSSQNIFEYSTYLTNNNNVYLTFTDTIDEYRAKIAFNDIELTQTLYTLKNGVMTTSSPITMPLYIYNKETKQNESIVRTWDKDKPEEMENIFSETEISRIKGTYKNSITSFTLSTKESDGGILYYREEIAPERFTYYIIVPAVSFTEEKIGDTNVSYQSDCLYTLSYKYLGNADDYKTISYEQDGTTVVSNENFQGITRTYIDHTAPYKNLLDLVENDTYLSTEEKNEIRNNLINPDYEFLQKYAFAVGPTFRLKNYGDSENSDRFYYRSYPEGKYNKDGSYQEQTSVQGRSDFSNSSKKFSPTSTDYTASYYSSFPAKSGYYDIIEIDVSGNYRVYTIYLNLSSVDISAVGTDAETTETSKNYYSMVSSFSGNTPTLLISETKDNIRTTLFETTGIATLTQASINIYSFEFNKLTIDDAWFTIKYRLLNNNNANAFKIIKIDPTKDTSEILQELNNFILDCIQSGRTGGGSKMEFIFNNRAGNDIRFFICSPGVELSLEKLFPGKVGQSSFAITMPSDTFSTQYKNFSIKMNGTIELTKDSLGNDILIVNTERNQPHTFTFSLTTSSKYTFEFVDNFKKKYKFVYPTTANLVNEVVFDENSTPKYYGDSLFSPNDTKYRYTSASLDRLSLTITDNDTGNILVQFNDLPYSNSTETTKTPKDVVTASQMYSTYFSTIKIGTTVTLTFKAIPNTNYSYSIQLTDIDNNKRTQKFGIYTYAPQVSFVDSTGANIWSATNSEKVTSKVVTLKWLNDESMLFNPSVTLSYGNSTTAISSGYSVSQEGTYKLTVSNSLGVINYLSETFTIKSATASLYSVYFNDQILQAHTKKYSYENMQIDHYFFLASSPEDWNHIYINKNEDKELSVEKIEDASKANTNIYRVYGNAHNIYFAVTRITNSNGNLTSFNIYSCNVNNPEQKDQAITNSDYSLRLLPDELGNKKYAQIIWNPTYVDGAEVYEDFVYLDITYNDKIYMGRFTSGEVNLTKSGKYTIEIHDIVGQTHRFGTSVLSTNFTLTILNEIIFYVNNDNPIQNATYNDEVILSLVDTSNYNWSNTGAISVSRNNAVYTDYLTLGTTWTFSEPGYYKVILSTDTMTSPTATIYAEYSFSIIDQNESMQIYEFAKKSGYTIHKIQFIEFGDIGETNLTSYIQQIKDNFEDYTPDTLRTELYAIFSEILSGKLSDETLESTISSISDSLIQIYDKDNYQAFEDEFVSQVSAYIDVYKLEDITDEIKDLNNVSVLQNFTLDPNTTGAGRYLITIKTKSQELIPEQTYSFIVWVNNEIPTIQASRSFGSSAKSPVTISYNASLLYSQVGNSYIAINGVTMATIDKTREDENQISTFTFSDPGSYLVQVYSKSGKLLTSQRITIEVPLNTASIILIVVGCVVVVAIITIFIILRTRMKVK